MEHRIIFAFGLTFSVGCTPFDLRSETTNFTRNQGGSGAQHVYVDRDAGHTEDVTLDIPSLPSGITATYEPTAVTGDVGIVHLAIDTSASTGDSTLTVEGTDTSGRQDATTIPLSVLGENTEDFGIDASPLVPAVAAGATVEVEVDLQWHGPFADDADLECQGLPSDITCTFADNPVPNGQETTTLTIEADATATEGEYPIIVHGEAGTQAKATALVLVVEGSGTTTTGSFAVRSEVGNFTINQEMEGSMTVYVDRTGGHNAPVTLTASADAGLTVSFEEPAPEGEAAVLVLEVDATGSTGDGTITVTGDDGTNTSSDDWPVTVNEPDFPDYTLMVNNHSVESAAGGEQYANISVQWGGSFTDDVELICNAPTEIACTLDVDTVTHPDTDSAVTLTVDASAASGVYPIEVEGLADGISKLVSFQVIVVP